MKGSTAPFVRVPVALYNDERATPREWAVYIVLAKNADYNSRTTYVGQTTIQNRTHYSERSVREALRVLSDLGFVKIERRWNAATHKTQNFYTLVEDRPATTDGSVPTGSEGRVGTNRQERPAGPTGSESRPIKKALPRRASTEKEPSNNKKTRVKPIVRASKVGEGLKPTWRKPPLTTPAEVREFLSIHGPSSEEFIGSGFRSKVGLSDSLRTLVKRKEVQKIGETYSLKEK